MLDTNANTCKLETHMSEICKTKTHVKQTMSNITQQACPTHVKHMSNNVQTMPTLYQTHVKHMSNICQTYIKHVS